MYFSGTSFLHSGTTKIPQNHLPSREKRIKYPSIWLSSWTISADITHGSQTQVYTRGACKTILISPSRRKKVRKKRQQVSPHQENSFFTSFLSFSTMRFSDISLMIVLGPMLARITRTRGYGFSSCSRREIRRATAACSSIFCYMTQWYKKKKCIIRFTVRERRSWKSSWEKKRLFQ